MESVSKKELFETMCKHIRLEVGEKGEYTGIREMRKHLAYYTKGLKNGSNLRNLINTIEQEKELIGVLKEYLSEEENI